MLVEQQLIDNKCIGLIYRELSLKTQTGTRRRQRLKRGRREERVKAR